MSYNEENSGEDDHLTVEQLKEFKRNLITMAANADQLRSTVFDLFMEMGKDNIKFVSDEIKALQATSRHSYAHVIGLLADIGYCEVFLNRFADTLHSDEPKN